jgi:membrane associated rhomboid family serine protease
MSIYSRSYMRDDYSPERSGGGFDALKWILITLLGVFILQRIVDFRFGADYLALYLGATPEGILGGGLHRLLTYILLHDTVAAFPIHLLFNGLVIFFVGRTLQPHLGGTRMLEAFLFTGILGGLLWFVLQLALGTSGILVGASAAALGLVTLFALLYWHETVRLIFIVFPIALEGRKIFYILLGLQAFFFLAAELGEGPNRTAYSAHLGGMGAGVLYFRYFLSRSTLWEWIRGRGKSVGQPPPWQNRAQAARKQTGRLKLNFKAPSKPRVSAADADLRSEVDRILDKINERGFGALSEEEKRTLDRAKDRLK